jgi:hypothetical protein
MAVSYENARRNLGKSIVWEYTTEESAKVAVVATLVKITLTPVGESKVMSLRLRTDDSDEPYLEWDAVNARPIVAESE